MKKKGFINFLVVVVCIVMLVGCSAGDSKKVETANTGTTDNPPTNKYAETIKMDWLFRSAHDQDLEHPCIQDTIMKEKYNVEINWTVLPPSDIYQKVALMATSNQMPDFIFFWDGNATLNKIGSEGYLYNVCDLVDKMPNYLKLYPGEDWNQVVDLRKHSDGGVYFFPQKRPMKSDDSWLYRKDVFDKMNIKYPETADDLYNAMKELKEMNPNAIIPNKWGWSGLAYGGILTMHGVQPGSFISPFTGEFVPFGVLTQEYRDAIRFANKLYKEEILDPEFITCSDAQFLEKVANGNAYLVHYCPNWDTRLTDQAKKSDPNAKFAYGEFYPQAYPERDVIPYIPTTIGCNFGPSISTNVKGDALDRLLDYLDWTCTEEGIRFITWGIEGFTYEMKDGKPQFKSNVQVPGVNTTGKLQSAFGIAGMNGNLVWPREGIKLVYGSDSSFDYGDKITANPKAKPIIGKAIVFTPEVQSEMADTGTLIWDKIAEYSSKFIINEYDPNNDSDWDKFINELKKLNVDAYVEKIQAAYDNSNKK